MQIGVGTGGNHDVLPALDGHNRRAGALPEAQFADGHADLVGIIRDPDFIIRQGLVAGERGSAGGDKLGADLDHLTAKFGILPVQFPEPVAQ